MMSFLAKTNLRRNWNLVCNWLNDICELSLYFTYISILKKCHCKLQRVLSLLFGCLPSFSNNTVLSVPFITAGIAFPAMHKVWLKCHIGKLLIWYEIYIWFFFYLNRSSNSPMLICWKTFFVNSIRWPLYHTYWGCVILQRRQLRCSTNGKIISLYNG